MILFDEEDEEPGFVVFDLPFLHHGKVYGNKSKEAAVRRLHPVLAVRMADGDVVVPDEALMWARSQIAEGVLHDQIRRRLSTVGRLNEYIQTIAPERLEQPGMIDTMVWAYLCARAETPRDIGNRVFRHWEPIQYEWVKTEFRDLIDFANFCRNFTGDNSIMGAAFRRESSFWSRSKRVQSQDSFYAHLNAQRAHWDSLLGRDDKPAPPPLLKQVAINGAAPKSANTTSLATDEVSTLIDRETNPMFRALWILLAWCGPRISEALNMFYCDMVGPDHARKLFRADFEGIVPVFADPKVSRFLGHQSAKVSVETRTAYLKRFGLLPRSDGGGKSQRAGWKGMSVFNSELLLTHGTWACKQRSGEFADLFAHIRQFHADERTTSRHPYLFVNYRNEEHIGEPMKYSNVSKAFRRAVIRAGIDPAAPGANLHGMRHFYTWNARNVLKVDEVTVQLMLRQRSPTSNRTYGKRAADLHDALADKMEPLR